MVRINRVYTKTGDQGQTSLIGGLRVLKSAPRIDCYGTVDELNAVLGLLCTALEDSPAGPALLPILVRVQNQLFNLGAQLATPDPERRAKMPAIKDQHISELEAHIDRLNTDLPELTSFVLPGGGQSSSYCHLARTVCRRAERLVVALAESEPEGVDALCIQYLNRLSDALFVFGRFAANADGRAEPLWQPETT
jgi:cob(I)alamin adenosyltransferase